MKIALATHPSNDLSTLKKIISSHPSLELIWTAHNGKDAFSKSSSNKPDILLLDLHLPILNAVQTTSDIMRNSPCAIILLTNSLENNDTQIYEAMGHGALDVLPIPLTFNDPSSSHSPLLDKIFTVGALIGKSTPYSQIPHSPHPKLPCVAIGSSTGGPNALASILSNLPASFPLPIIIIQHIHADFAPSLANSLSKYSKIPVSIPKNFTTPLPNNVYLASTNDHLILNPNGQLQYSQDPLDSIYRPSVDVFFKSLYRNSPTQGIALLLTGIGRDGADGLLLLKKRSWITIAQDSLSSAVFGMPKAAIDLHAASLVLPLAQIPSALTHHAHLLSPSLPSPINS